MMYCEDGRSGSDRHKATLYCRGLCQLGEPDHPRAGQWYYQLQLGPLEHKLPPIVANRWRRGIFIVTSGDRFMEACKQDQRPL